MFIKYALVQDGKIVKIRIIDESDMTLIPKLVTHHYLPIFEISPPAYDYITQTVKESLEIKADKILQSWTVIERPFDEAYLAKKNDIDNKAIGSIKPFFDGIDQNTKVASVLLVKDTAVAAIKIAKTNADLRAIQPIYPSVVVVKGGI